MRDNLVFAMAVDAERDVHVSLESFSAVNAFFVDVENSVMTFAAGFRPFGHQMRFADSLDVVNSVTVCTDRCIGRKALFQKCFAVHALEVFVIGGFAVNVEFNDHLHILMADRTGERDVHSVDCGFGVRRFLDAVFGVTVPAFGHFLHASLQVSFAVHAVRVEKRSCVGFILCCLSMALSGTVHIRKVFFMRDFRFFFARQNLMTIRAFMRAVHRRREVIFVDLKSFLALGFRIVTG